MFEIEFYALENGKEPARDFIKGLSPKMQAKALRGIDVLAEQGNIIREPFSKHIKNGLFELRIKFSSDITRIFYFFYKDNKIIVTNGFIKKTNGTPISEIEKGLKYKADYERSKKNE